MTNTEAIEMLKQWNEDLSFFDDEKDGIECHTLAISALKKQIPKKPIKSDREIRYCEVWKCPNCGFEWSGRIVDYCYKCGQAIDWGDE